MKNASLSALCALAILLVPGVALAHPGHGLFPATSPLHYVFSPAHAWPVLLALVVSATLLVLRGKRRELDEAQARRARDRNDDD